MNKGQNSPKMNTSSRLKKLMDDANIKNARELAKSMYQKGLITIGISSKETDINNARRIIDRHLKGEGISMDWLKRYCDFFGCSADYLLGYISLSTHNQTNIYNETGLTEKSIKRLCNRRRENDFLNALISSDYFFELDHQFSQLKSAIANCNSCINTAMECEENAKILDSTTAAKENAEVYFSLVNSAEKWGLAQVAEIYMMGVTFTNILNAYKTDNSKQYNVQ